MIRDAVHTLLATIVLLTLHLIHGSTLLLTLLLQCGNALQSTRARLDATTLHKDAQRWKKVPKHLAVVFVPAARGKCVDAEK